MKRNIQIAFVLITVLIFASVFSLKENPFQGGEKELVCTAPVTKKVLNNKFIQPHATNGLGWSFPSYSEQEENLYFCKNSTIARQYAFRFDTDLMDKKDSVKVQTNVLDNCITVYNLDDTKRGEHVVKSERLKATSQYLQFYRGIGIKPYFEVDRKTLEVVKGEWDIYDYSCAVKNVAKQRNKI